MLNMCNILFKKKSVIPSASSQPSKKKKIQKPSKPKLRFMCLGTQEYREKCGRLQGQGLANYGLKAKCGLLPDV